MSQGKALYNRWRPRTFADVVGQEHVTRTLRNALASGQLAHAYLFCGPRGTGKTSVARILARAVNCKQGLQPEPCNRCENCLALLADTQLDLLIEIDGASNTGVDSVRELRENVYKRPGGGDLTGRYKVYIIDEVHMLSTSAFNALLKTLEEPPPHVIFMFATTDPEKIPGTVHSRCQRFYLKPVTLPELIRHLQEVARAEGVEAEPRALELIARTATGSIRDSLSLLEQAMAFCGRTITLAQVQSMLGLTPLDMVSGLVDCVLTRDFGRGLALIQDIVARGADLRQLDRQVVQFLRLLLLEKGGVAGGATLALGDELAEAVLVRRDRISMDRLLRAIKLFAQAELALRAPGVQPQLPLELAFVEAILNGGEPAASGQGTEAGDHELGAEADARVSPGPVAFPVPSRPGRAVVGARETVAADAGIADPSVESEAPIDTALQPLGPLAAGGDIPAAAQDAAGPAPRPGVDAPPGHPSSPPSPPPRARGEQTGDSDSVALDRIAGAWGKLLELLRTHHKMLHATLKDCRAIAVDPNGTAVIACRYSIHQAKLEDPPNRVVVERALTRVLGKPCRIRCVVDGPPAPRGERARRAAPVEDPVVKAAIKIFNARILTEAESVSPDAAGGRLSGDSIP